MKPEPYDQLRDDRGVSPEELADTTKGARCLENPYLCRACGAAIDRKGICEQCGIPAAKADLERLERAGRLGLHTKESWPDDTLTALLTLCDAGLYVLRSDWDGRTVKGANEILQRAHDSIQARELLEAAESVLTARIDLAESRLYLTMEIRQFLETFGR